MNVLRNQRTLQIQQLSEYMRKALALAGHALWLGWPVLAIMFWNGKMEKNLTVKIGSNISMPADELMLPQRIALILGCAVALFLTQLAVHHARILMEHFSAGRIFDASALATAKKAINCGLGLFALRVFAELAEAVYTYTGKITVPGPAMTLFYGFLFFGLLHVMLWALEIGRDLNDESALTI